MLSLQLEVTQMDIIAFLTPYPAWIKILFAIGAFCVFAAVVGMIFTSIPKSTAETPSSGTVNVTSNNQKGGVTANTVNTNKP
jgi:hypothetical protein